MALTVVMETAVGNFSIWKMGEGYHFCGFQAKRESKKGKSLLSFLSGCVSLSWTVLFKRKNVTSYIKLCLSLLVIQDRKGDVTANEVADYDGIVVRLRGDGRTYTLNVQTKGIRDDDIHQSFFHTRGGPYWEIVRVR